MNEQRFSYGGQAVLEGVMMRGRRQATVAVRSPTGDLAFKHFPIAEAPRAAWTRLPVIRGFVALKDAFTIGREALDFSAAVVAGEGEEELHPVAQWATFLVALAVGVGLFVVLPS